MSLLVVGLLCACAGAATAAHRAFSRKVVPHAQGLRAEVGIRPRVMATPERAFDLFGVKLGDVLVRSNGEEAWCSSAIVLSENAPVAVLFVAPNRGQDIFVFATAPPDAELVWLAPWTAERMAGGVDPPPTLDVGDVRYERRRRRPLRLAAFGPGAPDLGEVAIVAEYTGMGAERLIFFKGASRTLAFRGSALDASTYEVITPTSTPSPDADSDELT